ncbi:phage tail protein I [Escherichia coli]|nr:phage tail protein I [Escherichia coli]
MSDLLPDNASALEKNLAGCNQAITGLRIPIRSLWDAWNCPLHLLPWLAWALSVDEWNSNWSESIKRQVVADAYEVHRFKGTPYAVQKALNSLNITTYLREWWEQDGSGIPGTITLVALINENITGDDSLLTPAMLNQIARVIRNTKRGVIHFDIELGLLMQETLALTGVVSAASALVDRDLEALPVLPDDTTGMLSIVGILSRHDYVEHEADFFPLKPEAIAFFMQVAGIHRQLLLCEFDLTGYLP